MLIHQRLQSYRIGAQRYGTIDRHIMRRLGRIRSSSFPIELSQRPPISHLMSSTASSSSSYESEIQSTPELSELESSHLIKMLRKCWTAFAIFAGIAAWLYLSSGPGSSGLFASITTSSTHAGAGGKEFPLIPMQAISRSEPQFGAGVELAAQSAWTGLATGVFHTLCGPDHLAVSA